MPSSYSSKHSAYLLILSPSIRYISFINSNGNSLRLICLNFIVLGVHFIGMIRIRINDPGSLRSQHIRRTDESTPGNDKQVRLKCYDSSDLRSLILMQVFPSAPRLINPKNHRFLAGAGGCPGGGRSYERQSESPKRLDRNRKSFSLEHLRRYPKIGIFLQSNRFISSKGLPGEGIIPDSFAKGLNLVLTPYAL